MSALANRAELARRVEEQLRRQPWRTLAAIAAESGVSRDTLERAPR